MDTPSTQQLVYQRLVEKIGALEFQNIELGARLDVALTQLADEKAKNERSSEPTPAS